MQQGAAPQAASDLFLGYLRLGVCLCGGPLFFVLLFLFSSCCPPLAAGRCGEDVLYD